MKLPILVPLVFGIITKTSATPYVNGLNTNDCDGAVTLASSWIGEANDVEMKLVFCPDLHQHALEPQTFATNVCGTHCGTNCFAPKGGGPDPNDCHVIAEALRKQSRTIGPFFEIGTGSHNKVVMNHKSCQTFFLNQASIPLEYCRTDWADLIDFVAFNCQAAQNAHGGNCVATDQRWFVQVNHS